MPSQAHLLLQVERMTLAADSGQIPRTIGWPMRAVMEMITSEGARAIGLEGEVGSLTPGKQADVLVREPNRQLGPPVTDPIASVLFYHSQIKTVLVNGNSKTRWTAGRHGFSHCRSASKFGSGAGTPAV